MRTSTGNGSLASSWGASAEAGGSPGQTGVEFRVGDATGDGTVDDDDAIAVLHGVIANWTADAGCSSSAGAGSFSRFAADLDADDIATLLDAHRLAQCLDGVTTSGCP